MVNGGEQKEGREGGDGIETRGLIFPLLLWDGIGLMTSRLSMVSRALLRGQGEVGGGEGRGRKGDER